jgi:hypothetical protein
MVIGYGTIVATDTGTVRANPAVSVQQAREHQLIPRAGEFS